MISMVQLAYLRWSMHEDYNSVGHGEDLSKDTNGTNVLEKLVDAVGIRVGGNDVRVFFRDFMGSTAVGRSVVHADLHTP